jgi:DNA-directed RNA polymerase specialized sigma24 family protein
MAKQTTMDAHEEMVRLLAIQIRRTAKTQAEAIVEMGKAGFGPTRIAQLLGTTTGTAEQALADAKRAKKKGKVTRGGQPTGS